MDIAGYTHYCYKYQSPRSRRSPNPARESRRRAESRRRRRDQKQRWRHQDEHGMPAGPACGDGGAATINSTNVHFHGMNVPPVCHQDDVINTLIQPGTPGFQYNVQVPATQPPGLYWYHPHVHGFTEFQVNGGAAGALIVEGMEKVRPEVAGTHRASLRDSPAVSGAMDSRSLSVDDQLPGCPVARRDAPIIQMKPGEKQFWRVANATMQDFLQLAGTGKWRAATAARSSRWTVILWPRREMTTTILIPPAGRAEFIVQAPATGWNRGLLHQ